MTSFEHRIPHSSSSIERDFTGIVWVGDEPGFHVNVRAKSVTDATAFLRAKYGKGCMLSVWNEQDAERPR